MERSTRSILALLERRWNGLWNGDRTDIKLIFNLRQKEGLDETAVQGYTTPPKGA